VCACERETERERERGSVCVCVRVWCGSTTLALAFSPPSLSLLSLFSHTPFSHSSITLPTLPVCTHTLTHATRNTHAHPHTHNHTPSTLVYCQNETPELVRVATTRHLPRPVRVESLFTDIEPPGRPVRARRLFLSREDQGS
jgi:hypothetical protein